MVLCRLITHYEQKPAWIINQLYSSIFHWRWTLKGYQQQYSDGAAYLVQYVNTLNKTLTHMSFWSVCIDDKWQYRAVGVSFVILIAEMRTTTLSHLVPFAHSLRWWVLSHSTVTVSSIHPFRNWIESYLVFTPSLKLPSWTRCLAGSPPFLGFPEQFPLPLEQD